MPFREGSKNAGSFAGGLKVKARNLMRLLKKVHIAPVVGSHSMIQKVKVTNNT